MFNGIVEGCAKVTQIDITPDKGARIIIEPPFDAKETKLGDSIAINGTCLTVVENNSNLKGNFLSFDAINETLRCTNLGLLKIDSLVNIERSLKAGDRIDGHYVTGHVDAVGKILDKTDDGVAITFKCELPDSLLLFIAKKGSVAINGVSLTVGDVTDKFFTFYIIPHTASVTNLSLLEVDSSVNIEVDVIARYVVNACKTRK